MKKAVVVLLHVFFWVLTTWVIYLAFGQAEYDVTNENGIVKTNVWRNVRDAWYFSLNNISKALLVYLNIFWLFPRYLKTRKLSNYLPTLAILLVSTLVVEQMISNMIIFSGGPIWVMVSPRLFLNTALSFFYLGISFVYCFARSWWQNEQQKSALVQEKLTTELAFLKAQVNPHFLFNTLNNLYSMASKTDSPELAHGIERLSQLMRYMLYDSNSETVPLDKELDYIKSFIEIQKLRLSEEDDFVLQFSVEGNTKAVRIAPMLLIPFVENAFKHGIDFKESSVIKIELMVEEHELVFSVFNSCPNIGTAMEKGKSGIGLENLKRRLELLYYGLYSLEIREDQDVHGAILKLRLT